MFAYGCCCRRLSLASRSSSARLFRDRDTSASYPQQRQQQQTHPSSRRFSFPSFVFFLSICLIYRQRVTQHATHASGGSHKKDCRFRSESPDLTGGREREREETGCEASASAPSPPVSLPCSGRLPVREREREGRGGQSVGS